MSAAAQPWLVLGASAVAIEGRALMIEGPPGSGKSSLCLALIERGAGLIGDDGLELSRSGDAIIAAPPPRASGLIEIRGVGLVRMDVAAPSALALILRLAEAPERLPESTPRRDVLGRSIPCLPFAPGTIAPAERALWALRLHGLI